MQYIVEDGKFHLLPNKTNNLKSGYQTINNISYQMISNTCIES